MTRITSRTISLTVRWCENKIIRFYWSQAYCLHCRSMHNHCKTHHTNFRTFMRRLRLAEPEFLYLSALMFWTTGKQANQCACWRYMRDPISYADNCWPDSDLHRLHMPCAKYVRFQSTSICPSFYLRSLLRTELRSCRSCTATSGKQFVPASLSACKSGRSLCYFTQYLWEYDVIPNTGRTHNVLMYILETDTCKLQGGAVHGQLRGAARRVAHCDSDVWRQFFLLLLKFCPKL